MLVKEYINEATHIRIFNDYCEETVESSKTKNIIISLLLKNLKMGEKTNE